MYTERDEAVKSWDNGRFSFSLCTPNETRPLSHGITADFLFLIYTERDEAVKSWDNGRFSFSLYTSNQTRPLSHGITADFFSRYIPNETRPLSHGITADFLFLIYTEPDEAVKSWDNGRFWFGLYNKRNNSIYTEQ